MLARIVESELQELGLSFSSEVRGLLVLFAEEVERWNRSVNLTALQGRALVRRLIVEPVWIGQRLELSGRLLDIGSGNGSPGFPLWITRRLEQLDLVEARVRRAAFLRHMAGLLKAPRIVVHRCRLEELRVEMSPDWISLQAVALTKELLAVLRVKFHSTTNVVWITSHRGSPVDQAIRISVPGSNTEVWSFRLDQF